jgi:hypothetical protein
MLYQRYHGPNLIIHTTGDTDTITNGFWQGDKWSGIVLAVVQKHISEKTINDCIKEKNNFNILGCGEYYDDNQLLHPLMI